MSSSLIVLVLILYFALLLGVSYLAGKRSTDNETFFSGNRQSPWWVVSIGMVGASVSGVSYVSVPGMVGNIEFSYMQTVLGFFFGYLVIAGVLLPLYYRLRLTSIYSYLGERFGRYSYTTGASFFLLSKTIGAAARLYIVALILQHLVFDAWGVPFVLTTTLILIMIWIYTFRSGIKSIVWTDTLQTLIMVTALVIMVVELMQQLNLNGRELGVLLQNSEMSRVFVFDDWMSRQHFVKQFFSGIFIAVVMTGLDQDMMQKNLSCKSLPEARKNMYWYGFAFIPVNLLFLLLGFLMLYFASSQGIVLPVQGDALLPWFAQNYFSTGVFLLFVLGIIAAAFSSADSALTALTTSFSIDILGIRQEEAKDPQLAKRHRMIIHAVITVIFIGLISLFGQLKNKSIIDTIYVLVSYTYGPLLGLFSFGLFTRHKPRDKWVPWIAIASPILCYGIDQIARYQWGYAFGYELLLLNGAITFIGLLIASKKWK